MASRVPGSKGRSCVSGHSPKICRAPYRLTTFGTEGSGGDHTNEIWQRALDVVPQGIGETRHQSSIRTSGRSALDSRGTAHSFRSVYERGCRDLAANAPSPANAASNRRRLPAGAAERSMSPKAAGVVAPSASDWKATSSASGAEPRDQRAAAHEFPHLVEEAALLVLQHRNLARATALGGRRLQHDLRTPVGVGRREHGRGRGQQRWTCCVTRRDGRVPRRTEAGRPEPTLGMEALVHGIAQRRVSGFSQSDGARRCLRGDASGRCRRDVVADEAEAMSAYGVVCMRREDTPRPEWSVSPAMWRWDCAKGGPKLR